MSETPISPLRRRMIDQGFTEFQTPILTASSPEGARESDPTTAKPSDALKNYCINLNDKAAKGEIDKSTYQRMLTELKG